MHQELMSAAHISNIIIEGPGTRSGPTQNEVLEIA